MRDWSRGADDIVALLRAEAGRNRTDLQLAELIDELSEGSEEFRRRWADHEVLYNRTGIACYDHPAVGDLILTYEDLVLPEDPGQTILVFFPEPDSPSQVTLERLATWVSTQPTIEW